MENDYAKAKRENRIEYADTTAKKAVIQKVNLFKFLESNGVKLPAKVDTYLARDLMYQAIRLKLVIPEVPFNEIGSIEKRALSDSFSKHRALFQEVVKVHS